jgi:hypothetical protein
MGTKCRTNFSIEIKDNMRLKDEILDYYSSNFNVAQFVSYSPCLSPRYSRIFGQMHNYHCKNIKETLRILIDNSQDKSVNIRTFMPDVLKGNPFHYGIKDVSSAYELLQKYSQEGYYTIVNETIDINDGGVSGVVMNNIIEFSPNDTPKCVDKPGVCSLPKDMGMSILNKIYGFTPNIDFGNNFRVEFSIHPKRRGFCKEHTIIWEVEQIDECHITPHISWPNNFSRFIGDKVFGLLIADEIGLFVPKSIVFSRNVAPFSFGKKTGLSEVWFRTSPSEKNPGKYPTYFGWTDPFQVFQDEDVFSDVASVLSQYSVDAQFSGAAIPARNGLIIEGVKGFGDDFMIGKESPIKLPKELILKIEKIYNTLDSILRKVAFEWVYDGKNIWIVQFSKTSFLSDSKIIYPGKANEYKPFFIEKGLDSLREVITSLKPNTGIELIGKIGISSHYGDILRNARIPSRLVTNSKNARSLQ